MMSAARRLLLLVLVALWCCACGGATKIKASDYPETQVTREVSDAPSPVEVLLHRTEYVLQADGQYEVTERMRYRILTEEGASTWGGIEAGWLPWYQARPEMRATVTTPQGQDVTLDPSTIAETAAYPEAPDIYSDARVLRAPLPAISVGAVVDQTIVTKTTAPFLGGAKAHYALVAGGVPRQKVEIEIDMPEGSAFAYELRDAEVEVTDETAGGRRHVAFRGGPYEPLEIVEAHAPYDVAPFPYVVFSTGTSWAALAKHYDRIVEDKLASLDFSDVVRQVVQDGDSRRDKANKLLQWVHGRVRYAGIEFGETAVIPRVPTETLDRGYGDCKDQATLLVGLLRAADIPAHVALLRAGYGEDVRAGLPALNVFNHAIVYLPGDEPLWIDPTSRYARVGELPASDHYRFALVVDDDTRELLRTPVPAGGDAVYEEDRVVHLPEYGSARVVERTRSSGFIERGLRASFETTESERKKALTEYVESTYNTDDLRSHRVSPPGDLTSPFSIELEAVDAKVAVTGMYAAEIILEPSVLFQWLPSPLVGSEERKIPLILPTPYRAEVRYEVHAPEGFVAEAVDLRNKTVELGPAQLEREVRAEGRTVRVIYRLSVAHHRWSADEVNAFRKAYTKVAGGTEPQLRLPHEAEKHKEARDAKAEVAALRRLASAHPESGVHRMRLAIGLVNLGLGHRGRKVAAEAVALEPKNANLHYYQGDIFSRDVLGRTYEPGWSFEAVKAAYRRAIELDPHQMDAQVQLGVAYEHDSVGERYGPNSRLDEAIAHYDAIDAEELAAHDDGGFVNNVLFALLYAGRFEEVQRRIDALEPAQVPWVVAVVAAAALEGPTRGVSRAEELQLTDEQRATVMEQAAGTLILLRLYPEAAALTRAAGEVSHDPNKLLMARVRGNFRKIDPMKMSAGTPGEAVKRTFALFGSLPDEAEGHITDVVSSRAIAADGSSSMKAFLGGLSKAGRESGLPGPVMGDAMVANYRAESEGDDATGYRVKVRAEVGNVEYQVFVVQEAGKYKLRAIGQTKSELGCEALHLIGRGRTKHAEQWLDWARDLVAVGGGEDPLRVEPFARLWDDDGGDREVAAAALCAQGTQAERAIAPLEAARKKAKPEQQTIIDHALLIAFETIEQPQRAITVATRLEKDVPKSLVARHAVDRAMLHLGQHQALRQRLRARGDDLGAIYMLANLDSQLGNHEAVSAHYQKMFELGSRGATVRNELAWRTLFTGKTNQQALDHALRAVQEDPNSDAYLHTLACVYAELGKVYEAQQTLHKVLALRKGGRPLDIDWWIVGRIAEHLGVDEDARAAYAKVRAPKNPSASVFELAEMRLKKLR